MAKNAYIGVGGVARKVKTPYIGIYQDAETICSYLEYIKSSGTQSIDTGMYLDFSKDVTVEMSFAIATANQRYSLFNSYKSSSYDSFGIEVYSSNQLRLYFNKGAVDEKVGTISANTKYTVRFEWIASSKKYTLYLNGTQIKTGTYSYSGTTPYTMMIFIDHRNNSTTTFSKALTVYSLSVQNGTVTKTFTPAKRASDNVVCLYESVEKTFFENKGSGTFTAGATTGETVTKAAGGYARKAKSGYIGVGGVARQFFSNMSPILYDVGNEYIDTTGGWTANAIKPWSGCITSDPIKGSDYIELAITTSAGQEGISNCGTVNAIELTGFNTLYVNVSYVNNAVTTQVKNNVECKLYSANTTKPFDSSSYTKKMDNMLKVGLYQLDISDLSGKFYIVINGYCYDRHYVYTRINKIWLE